MATQFSEIPFVQLLQKRRSKFLFHLEEVFLKASDHLSNRVPIIFPSFTLHNIEHSIRILRHIEQLIENVDELNDFEIILILYTAFLHDIGMGPDEEIIDGLKTGNIVFSDIKFSALLKKFDQNEHEALSYLVRKFHAEISALMIKKHYCDYLVFPEMDHLNFVETVSNICIGHTKDIRWISRNLKNEELSADYTFNSQYILSLLRLGDILDIDGKRTPTILYDLIKPSGISESEWQKHYVITNEKKIRIDRPTDEKAIFLFGKCSNVEIHRILLTYIKYINLEIENALNLSRKFLEKHKIYLRSRVIDKIEPKGYTLSSLRLEIDYSAISNLLMGEKIYGDKKYGLREIIQNSIDACKVRREIKEVSKKIEDEEYFGKIKIVCDFDAKKVSIIDNGIGMNDEIIRKYFLSVGKSFYKSDDFLLQDLDYSPIGNFGIGFLSCFMLSIYAKIYTRKEGESKAYTIEIDKTSEYVSYTEIEESSFVGTKIELDLTEFI